MSMYNLNDSCLTVGFTSKEEFALVLLISTISVTVTTIYDIFYILYLRYILLPQTMDQNESNTSSKMGASYCVLSFSPPVLPAAEGTGWPLPRSHRSSARWRCARCHRPGRRRRCRHRRRTSEGKVDGSLLGDLKAKMDDILMILMQQKWVNKKNVELKGLGDDFFLEKMKHFVCKTWWTRTWWRHP